MAAATLSSQGRLALERLARELHEVFGIRLRAVCAYSLDHGTDSDLRSIVFVDRLRFDDFSACVRLAREWSRRGLAAPLILDPHEFARTLDVFPLEYGEIIANHAVIYGEDPFLDVEVAVTDRRRACELQAKSLLIHLREGFLETYGDGRAVASLIGLSAEAFRRLLINIIALVAPGPANAAADLPTAAASHLGVEATVVRDVLLTSGAGLSTIVEPTALLGRYVAAVEQIWELVDAWKRG